MFSVFNALRGFVLVVMAFLISACDPALMNGLGTGTGIRPGQKVQVALLLPKGSADPNLVRLANSAEAAARLAVAELGETAEIDLRFYDTAGDAQQAAGMAVQAVDEGAKIILGPLFAEAANAAGQAISGRGVNILSLSNNVEIAGGNVFVMGNTFQNSADRLVSYARSQGKKRVLIVHARNIAGEAGAKAVQQALLREGLEPAGVEGYEFSQQGVFAAISTIASRHRAVGADVLLMTADFDGALAPLAQLLPEAGIDPATVQYAGLARFDAQPSGFNLPGINGGWFTLPNPQRIAQFRARYEGAYGAQPHPLAAIAYDGIAAIGASVASGNPEALTVAGLTQPNGFQGAAGIFRFRTDGTIQRGLAVATIEDGQVRVISSAPASFDGAGS